MPITDSEPAAGSASTDFHRATEIHVVMLNWRNRAACPTIAPEALADLQDVVRRAWWRLSFGFRKRPLRLLEDWRNRHGRAGLLFCERRTVPEIPPPFGHEFEAIELGSRDPGLRTLVSRDTTLEERTARFGWGVIAILIVAWMGFALYQAIFGRFSGWLVVAPVGLVFFTLSIIALARYEQRRSPWLIVPGAIAVCRYRRRADPEVTLFTPADSILHVGVARSQHGQFHYLRVLNTPHRALKRLVSQREQLAVLAAWRSRVAPPALHELQEWLR